jgi:hypothetical protein
VVFSADGKLVTRATFSISGLEIKLLVAATLCRSSAIVDNIRLIGGVGPDIRAAQAAVLNDDMLIFRRLIDQMPGRDLADVSLFAARLGRAGFAVERGFSFNLELFWLSDADLPEANVKRKVVPVLSWDGVMILDRSDYDDTTCQQVINDDVIARALYGRYEPQIVQIVTLGKWVEFQGNRDQDGGATGGSSWDQSRGSSSEQSEGSGKDGRGGSTRDVDAPWSGMKILDCSKSPIEVIGKVACFECRRLTEVRLGVGLRKVGREAFARCSSLVVLSFPDGFVKLGRKALCGCVSLKEVRFGKGLKKVGQECFSGCSCLEGLIFPDGVLEIGNAAFYHCTSLKTVKVGCGLKRLSFQLFNGCSSLVGFVIPEGVEEIDSQGFIWCTSLKHLWVKQGVKKIGSMAFCGCSSLVYVALPDWVEEIGKLAFEGCASLKTVCLGRTTIDLHKWKDWGLSPHVEVQALPRRHKGGRGRRSEHRKGSKTTERKESAGLTGLLLMLHDLATRS